MKKNISLAFATRHPSRTLARLGVVTLVCSTFAVLPTAYAGTARTWDGGTSGTGFSWTGSTGANWNPDGVPVSGDILTLGATPNIPT